MAVESSSWPLLLWSSSSFPFFLNWFGLILFLELFYSGLVVSWVFFLLRPPVLFLPEFYELSYCCFILLFWLSILRVRRVGLLPLEAAWSGLLDWGVLMFLPLLCDFMLTKFVSIEERLELVWSICILPPLLGVWSLPRLALTLLPLDSLSFLLESLSLFLFRLCSC